MEAFLKLEPKYSVLKVSVKSYGIYCPNERSE